jgi:hypothetical protein
MLYYEICELVSHYFHSVALQTKLQEETVSSIASSSSPLVTEPSERVRIPLSGYISITIQLGRRFHPLL